MKNLLLLFVLGVFFYSCAAPHRCPTYSNSGAKWNKHNSHPYGGNHKH